MNLGEASFSYRLVLGPINDLKLSLNEICNILLKVYSYSKIRGKKYLILNFLQSLLKIHEAFVVNYLHFIFDFP